MKLALTRMDKDDIVIAASAISIISVIRKRNEGEKEKVVMGK